MPTLSLRVLALSCLAACACAPGSGGSEPVSLPESFRGAYGRTASDAFLKTLGMEVDVDTLRYSEMELKIITGKEVGTDNVQVTLAELSWAKENREPRKCKGTIARQGDRLLLSLFLIDSDAKCDSALDGEWKAWKPLTAFPEPFLGAFGSTNPYAAGFATTIEGPELRVGDISVPLVLEQAVAFDADPSQVFVRRARFGQVECSGTIAVAEDRLSGELEVVPSADGAEPDVRGGCPGLHGQRWTIDKTRLPKTALGNGAVRIEIRGEAALVTTTDDQGLRCEQAIVRTAQRNAGESGRDGIPVMGGTIVALAPAAPKAGTEGCRARLLGLADAECEEMLFGPCAPGTFGADADPPEVVCPTHLVIGDEETGGRKVALLPGTVQTAVCWETKERFVAK